MNPTWYVYICDRQGKLYTGITTNVDHRMTQHHARLLYSEPHPDRHSAARREREIKGWRCEKKLAVIQCLLSVYPERSEGSHAGGTKFVRGSGLRLTFGVAAR